MAEYKTNKTLSEENLQLKAELDRLSRQKSVELSEGTIVHNTVVPVDAPRPAFGNRNTRFEEISNFFWRVTPRRITEKKKGYVEGSNGKMVSYEVHTQPATMITVVLKRAERGADGVIATQERGGCFPLPFFTFDNSLTAEGISVRDVAYAIWQKRESWGREFEVEMLDEDQVNTYFMDRMSEDQKNARAAMADPSLIAERAGRNLDLINQGIMP